MFISKQNDVPAKKDVETEVIKSIRTNASDMVTQRKWTTETDKIHRKVHVSSFFSKLFDTFRV